MGVQFLLRPLAFLQKITRKPTASLFRYRLSLALALAFEAKLSVEAYVTARRALVNNGLLAADVVTYNTERQSLEITILALLLEKVYEATHKITPSRCERIEIE